MHETSESHHTHLLPYSHTLHTCRVGCQKACYILQQDISYSHILHHCRVGCQKIFYPSIFYSTLSAILTSYTPARRSEQVCTARSVEDETQNDRRNANRNPEWWGDFSQLQNSNHNLNLYWEIRRNSDSIKISI